ncbi:uncharacterized protein [Epargyreus clarus]|uniref:uncharacterized protein n=1 Tax=Epargyreus clarus TaxID=520877 RepID=UPI003C2F2376
MNIALLCVLIIVTGGTDGFHVENARTSHKQEMGQRILLRKLQTFQRADPKEKTATWNQILADALVNRIKIFSFNKATESELQNNVDTESNFLTNCISQMMHLYKRFFYNDNKINKHTDDTLELSKEEKKLQNANKGIVETEKDFADPKDEVEILEPRYHGKLCVNCDKNTENETVGNGTETVEITEKVETVTGCPDGLVANEGGGCTDAKSKFILSIPYQCPTGYRRDWLGYCRPLL